MRTTWYVMPLQFLPALKAKTVLAFVGLSSYFGIVMTVFSCICETVSCVVSILVYRTLRTLRGLKPLARAINLKPELVNTTRTIQPQPGEVPLISYPQLYEPCDSDVV